MRKTVFVIISLAFTGGLLVYTAQANLDLLTRTYPKPEFVGFGMLALEGGVIYWTGAYLLHWLPAQKGIAITMIAIDACFSLVGFFLDIDQQTHQYPITNLPPVVVLIAADVALNVGMGIIVHLLPDDRKMELPSPLVELPSLLKQRGKLMSQTKVHQDEN